MRPSLPLTAAAAEPRATHPHCHQQSVQARRAGPSGPLMPAAAASCAAPLALPAAHVADALALVLLAAGAAASCSLRSGQQPIHPSGPCERLSPSAIDACLPACLQRLAPHLPPAAGNRRASVGLADASPRGRPRGWPPAAAPRSTPRAHGIVDATVLAAAAAAAEPHATHPHGQQRLSRARRQSSGIDHGIPPTPAVAVSRTAPRTHGVDVIMIDAAVLPLTAAAAEPRATHPHCHQQSVQARRAGPSGPLMPAAAASCDAPHRSHCRRRTWRTRSPSCCWQPAQQRRAACAAGSSRSTRAGPARDSLPARSIDACLPASSVSHRRHRRASVGLADASPRGRPRG